MGRDSDCTALEVVAHFLFPKSYNKRNETLTLRFVLVCIIQPLTQRDNMELYGFGIGIVVVQ
jgi:hypothetical protein